MKRTYTINISSNLFHIEEDAYEALQKYLQKLKTHFGNSAEGREILSDIEGRIAELFNDKVRGDARIVTLELVEEVVLIMGTPEDFMEEEHPETANAAAGKVKKRLYRHPDARILAGVCGGLGNYFKMDPVLVRIIFVVLFFANGVGLLAYIILWIAVPKARTAAQKLEMRGEEVNISNIERAIKVQPREEANPEVAASEDETEIPLAPPTESIPTRDYSAELGNNVLRGVSIVVGIFLTLFGFLGLVAVISTFLVGQSLVDNWPLLWDFDIPVILGFMVSPGSMFLGMLSIAVLVGIPFLALLFWGSKLILNYKTNNQSIGLGFLGIWLISLLVFTVITVSQVANFTGKTSVSQTEPIDCGGCDTLYVELAPNRFAHLQAGGSQFEGFRMVETDGAYRLLGTPKLAIESSSTGELVMVLTRNARGRDGEDAANTLQNLLYSYKVEGNRILLDRWFLLGDEAKWRDQHLTLTLRLPEGKVVHLDQQLQRILQANSRSGSRAREMAGKYWTMAPGGLIGGEEILP